MNSLSYKDNRNYLVNLLAAALSNTTTTSAWFCNALAAHAVSIGPSIIALTASALFSPLGKYSFEDGCLGLSQGG